MTEKDMMHGQEWDGVADLTGWRVTEKLNGCRLFWDGTAAWTRSGRRIVLPAGWPMPPAALDCELWAGRGRYQVARNAMNHGDWSDPALGLRVFEAPGSAPGFCPAGFAHLARVPDYGFAASNAAVKRLRDAVQAAGGEGLMVRHPGLRYAPGRTASLLKVL
jgi:DNA ligase-1